MSQPLLRKLEIVAGEGQLSPTFDPYQANYQLQVNYDQLVFRMRAAPFSDEVVLVVEGNLLQNDQWYVIHCSQRPKGNRTCTSCKTRCLRCDRLG